MAKIKVDGWRCDRCGYEWAPRTPGKAPEVCPKCKSPYWDKPYQSEAAAAKGAARRAATAAPKPTKAASKGRTKS